LPPVYLEAPDKALERLKDALKSCLGRNSQKPVLPRVHPGAKGKLCEIFAEVTIPELDLSARFLGFCARNSARPSLIGSVGQQEDTA
jgi:hypothetical protein